MRELAAQHGLITHNKRDSTGICFIGERRFRDFLARFLPAQPGEIQTPQGEVLGQHQGLMYHTLGQRQGLGIGGISGAPEAAWYVAEKDVRRNVLVVVQGNDNSALFCDGLTTRQLYWVDGEGPDLPLRCTAKTRYRQADQHCLVQAGPAGGLRVTFEQPQRAVTPGQSVVFYTDQRCLGGGIIEETWIFNTVEEMPFGQALS